jgi:hypothetical protein
MKITEDLSLRFRRYLLNNFNGDTPSNYFSLLGQTSTKYVYETYKRHRLADNRQYVEKLPCVEGGTFPDLMLS